MLRKASIVAALSLISAGCLARDRAAPAPAPAAPPPLAPAEMDRLKSLGYVQDAGSARAVAIAHVEPQRDALADMAAARKLIRSGQLTIEVAAYDRAAVEVARLATFLGGYVSETRATRGDAGKQRGALTIRVPAERFEEAVVAFAALGRVRSENLGTQDVTKAYADLETRLRVKRETAHRLVDLLRNRTGKLSDVLEAEREIARVTEEIEQMEGERRFYDQQIALSTLSVELYEPASIVGAGVWAPIGEAFTRSLEVLAASLAGLVYGIVFLTPWLLAAFVAWRAWKRLRRTRAA